MSLNALAMNDIASGADKRLIAQDIFALINERAPVNQSPGKQLAGRNALEKRHKPRLAGKPENNVRFHADSSPAAPTWRAT